MPYRVGIVWIARREMARTIEILCLNRGETGITLGCLQHLKDEDLAGLPRCRTRSAVVERVRCLELRRIALPRWITGTGLEEPEFLVA